MADIIMTRPAGVAGTTTSPPAITSFPRNPLTKSFSRPKDCTGVSKSTFLAMMDLSSTCLPPGLKTESDAYFSPGIACPSGYVSACHDNNGVASLTTVTCCPTLNREVSLSCVDDRTLQGVWKTLFCTWIAPKTKTTLPVTLSQNGVTSTENMEFSSPDGVNAFGIRMVYQKTDTDTPTATTTSSGGTGQTTSSEPIESETSTPSPDDDGGLSTGATVAIGVVVPVVVIAALLGILLWWRRRRRHHHSQTADGGGGELYKYQPQQTAELHGQPMQELQGSVVDPVELPGSNPHPRRP
ncbi:hypothetical protein JDV02_000593 [Purpureocillium takamizusanense]|uniref:Mid2 domain-containing protein n=1 Tax=Purpureocillium takamizusanense TaxID=2060973 RepID=A0A9Q8Q580_9HYPO|nr:uncharacterized protein JDV02_000593 [Purpureocillium takamizusanense]UNI13898.1 hypothetical protein JDV02_000593 [Purpureocillium takamizusanense]